MTVIEILSQGYVMLKCSCGTVKRALKIDTLNNKVKSCGCLRVERSRERRTSHGMSYSSEYQSWKGMRNRCYRVKDSHYHLYGGRGITVCDRWLHSFQNFFDDMGKRPDYHSLDRINSDGNYEPSNCRWADSFTQQANKRVLVTVNHHQPTEKE